MQSCFTPGEPDNLGMPNLDGRVLADPCNERCHLHLNCAWFIVGGDFLAVEVDGYV
jgi:hypothetical protein